MRRQPGVIPKAHYGGPGGRKRACGRLATAAANSPLNEEDHLRERFGPTTMDVGIGK